MKKMDLNHFQNKRLNLNKLQRDYFVSHRDYTYSQRKHGNIKTLVQKRRTQFSLNLLVHRSYLINPIATDS